MKLISCDKSLFANNALIESPTIFLVISGNSLLIDSMPFASI